MRARSRRIAVIGASALTFALDDALNGVQAEVLLLESVARAYTHVKRHRPDLVVLCLSGDDHAECQLLSMLALDRLTAAIPIVLCPANRREALVAAMAQLDVVDVASAPAAS